MTSTHCQICKLQIILSPLCKKQLLKLNLGNKTFFIAVGFHKPHLPFVFPEEFLQFYPKEDIHLPDNPFVPVDTPAIAWRNYGELRSYHDISKLHLTGNINTTVPNNIVLALRRAQYSALTYTDFQIRRVLMELKTLGLTDNIIVSIWGDHGWQL